MNAQCNENLSLVAVLMSHPTSLLYVSFFLIFLWCESSSKQIVLSCILSDNCIVLYVEINCQLDATEVFIADLIACSTRFGHHYAHHQELKSIIQWLLRVVFCAVVFQVAGLVWS